MFSIKNKNKLACLVMRKAQTQWGYTHSSSSLFAVSRVVGESCLSRGSVNGFGMVHNYNNSPHVGR